MHQSRTLFPAPSLTVFTTRLFISSPLVLLYAIRRVIRRLAVFSIGSLPVVTFRVLLCVLSPPLGDVDDFIRDCDNPRDAAEGHEREHDWCVARQLVQG